MEEANSIITKLPVFTDDPSVPDTTIIYVKRQKAMIGLLLSICSVLIGLYILLDKGNIFGKDIEVLFLIPIGLYTGFKAYRKIKNSAPQISLSKNGIQIEDSDCRKWSEITGEEINWLKKPNEFGMKTNYSKGYLVFNNYGEKIEKEIEDLAITDEELVRLMKIYRGRSAMRGKSR